VTAATHLRSGGVSVVVDHSGPDLPAIVHWGADLGELDDAGLASVLLANGLPARSQGPDDPVRVAVLPEHATGWLGRPGLAGAFADGTDWAPRFVLSGVEATATSLVVQAVSAAGLHLTTELVLSPQGLLRARHTLRNDGRAPYSVQSLVVALPVPPVAQELLDLTGRWCRERSPQRKPFDVGTWLREARGGRSGHDASTVLLAGAPGFGFRHGEAWGVHLAWAGNGTAWAERSFTGTSVLAAGELLQPGEIELAPADSYEMPWVFGTWSDAGLDGISSRFHQWLRARPAHPRRPRPVTLNVWEAVYFDHDLGKLLALVQLAAETGVERFVLDDGWFRHRRDDTAGLGDWYVDETVWPQGLSPLVDAVRAAGMEFGLWFEPEMVNLDSDLARAHPDWLLGASSGLPGDQRHQQVLDLGQQPAWDYLLERIDRLLSEYAVSYVKWDHNRHLVAASGRDGRAGVHRQTEALYALLDELRRRHPGLEIESCASGGGRVDLGILEHTDRVWTSDCNDALERQSIQRWTGLLLPPELMGAHVGPTRSHTTQRTHDLSFRAATALFGHFGIEWDISAANGDEREQLRDWISLYTRLRGLLHTGDVVRADSPDPAYWLHGVVATDRSAAVFAFVRLTTSVVENVGALRLPGLDPARTYAVRAVSPGALPLELEATGRVLGEVGVQGPALHPEHALVVELIAR
jgi:alpha-galactosidase